MGCLSIQPSVANMILPEITTSFQHSLSKFLSARRFKCKLVLYFCRFIDRKYFRFLEQAAFTVATFSPSVKFSFTKNDEKKSTKIEIRWHGGKIFRDFSLLHTDSQGLKTIADIIPTLPHQSTLVAPNHLSFKIAIRVKNIFKKSAIIYISNIHLGYT